MSVWKIIAPEATHNLVANPSFEWSTTGWVNGGVDGGYANFTRESAFHYRGAYSAAVRPPAAPTGQNYIECSVPVSAGATYTISAWVRTGQGSCTLTTVQTGGVTTTTHTPVPAVSGVWQRVEQTITTVAGTTTLLVRLRDDGSGLFAFTYWDAVQVEQKSYSTTYCDGDQPGCRWTGTAHASASKRDEFEASGGKIVDFENELGFAIERLQGPGMPPVQNHSQALALLPGTRHDGQNVDAKVLSILGSVYDAKTLPEYHARRQALVRAFNSRRRRVGGKQQPRSIYYNRAGAAGEDFRELRVVYDGGLELNRLPRQRGFSENIALRLRQDDPFTYELKDESTLIDGWQTATFRGVGAKVNGRWTNLGPPGAGGTYTSVEDIAIGPDGKVYFGGNFVNFDGISTADYIVRWNPETQTWESIGGNLNALVRVLQFGPDGILYVGGLFTNAAGIANADYIATYNPATNTWGALGTGLNEQCRALHFGQDGNLYVAGAFTSAGGVANTNRVAYWDGAAWKALDRGLNNVVVTLAMDANGLLYAGGFFTADVATSTTMTRMAVFDTVNGGAWKPLQSPSGTAFSFDGVVEKIVVAPDGRTLYIGGRFTDHIKRWNGSTLLDLGTGITTSGVGVRDLAFLPDGRLLIVGDIDTAGDIAAENFTIWNGSVYAYPDITFPGATDIMGVTTTPSGDIYVSGMISGSGVYAAGKTVSYSGGEPAYPRLIIKRTGGTMAQLRYLANETTGAVLYFNYHLLNGETLTLDLNPRNPVFESSFRGRLWQIMRQASHVGDFFLLPANSGSQDNLITLFVAASGFPTMDCRLVWRNAYSGVD